ncbi:hypothetical protein AVEN_158110-1 [Araneus ventricosus]|uniref:Tc1-like transposase DDE domain-containing protein n=1 Tax=Araneus ventricosus TaxID=182803 RepID=A0A4Y2GMY2_ARAVE|nr:hypothetical protein AVEN_158110-1 [Araneus ventricosus]
MTGRTPVMGAGRRMSRSQWGLLCVRPQYPYFCRGDHSSSIMRMDPKKKFTRIRVPSISEKKKESLGHREAIRHKRPGMSYCVILLHDNIHTALKTQKLLRKFKWEVWSQPPYSLDLALQQTLIWNMVSSDSDVKTVSIPSRIKQVGPAFR